MAIATQDSGLDPAHVEHHGAIEKMTGCGSRGSRSPMRAHASSAGLVTAATSSTYMGGASRYNLVQKKHAATCWLPSRVGPGDHDHPGE